jgi:hypothetical protein
MKKIQTGIWKKKRYIRNRGRHTLIAGKEIQTGNRRWTETKIMMYNRQRNSRARDRIQIQIEKEIGKYRYRK